MDENDEILNQESTEIHMAIFLKLVRISSASLCRQIVI